MRQRQMHRRPAARPGHAGARLWRWACPLAAALALGVVQAQGTDGPSSPTPAAASPVPASVPVSGFTDCATRPVARDPSDWTLVATGDIVPTDSQATNARAFDGFAGVFRSAGLVLGNLEGAITTHPTPRKRYVPGRSYAFRFPPATAQLLKEANFHVLSLANNHAHDYGNVGLADTVRLLAQVGIDTTGAPGTIALRQVGGTRVAVVAMAHYAAFNNVLELEQAARLVAKARSQADLVVVYYQLGAEGAPAARLPQGPENFLGEARGDARAFAQRMVQAGAGLLVGHGPHVLRAAECIGGVPVLHSVGNFVSAGGLSVQGLSSVSVLPEILFDAKGTAKGVRIHPVSFSAARFPQPDPTGRGVQLLNWLSRDAQRVHADLKPLLLPAPDEGSEAFEQWLRSTPLGSGGSARR